MYKTSDCCDIELVCQIGLCCLFKGLNMTFSFLFLDCQNIQRKCYRRTMWDAVCSDDRVTGSKYGAYTGKFQRKHRSTAKHNWPFFWRFNGERRFHLTKGQLGEKCSHLIKSSKATPKGFCQLLRAVLVCMVIPRTEYLRDYQFSLGPINLPSCVYICHIVRRVLLQTFDLIDWLTCGSCVCNCFGPDCKCILDTVKPVCNDHLYNKIYYLWFIQ